MSRKSNKFSKANLPLIGNNYWWYDEIKGVARTKIRKNILGKNDQSPRLNWKTWFKNKDSQIRWYTDPNFVTGNNNFDYVRVRNDDIENYEKLTRASFIPYIVKNNNNKEERYWLLGSFFDFPEIKVDFGGKCNRNETPTNCATRELREETRGVLSASLLETLANKDLVTIFKGYNKNNDKNNDDRTVFILVNMTNHLDDLDKIQKEIDTSRKITNEEFGPLGFYKESDVFNGFDSNGKILTSYALTDFINWYKNRKIYVLTEFIKWYTRKE